MKKIFLTGGTGFVGSNIAYQLLKLGYKVIFLVREVAGITAEQRLKSVFDVIDENFDLNKYSYQIVRGDICLPNLGICADELNSLKADKPDSIFHCAGSISFSEREADKDIIWKINVEGTRNIIAFSKALGAVHIFYMSSAYVAGKSEGLCHEEVKCPEGFNNFYEETKLHGEISVMASELPYSIFRPSIVIANQNGHILCFSGYYMCAKLFWILKRSILNHWKKDIHYYDGTGISVEEGNRLILPVSFERRFQSKLNLVPVDWLVETIIHLSEKNGLCRNQVFHLTHPNPPDVEDVIKNSMDILGIAGVKIVDSGVKAIHQNRILNAIQMQINEGMTSYFPYTGQNIFFKTFHTESVLNHSYQSPPPIDKMFLERTLTYAIAHNFKR